MHVVFLLFHGHAAHLEEAANSPSELDQYISLDKTDFMTSPNDFSVCFWLNPHTIKNYNNAIYVGPNGWGYKYTFICGGGSAYVEI